jgi:hypothetical protein
MPLMFSMGHARRAVLRTQNSRPGAFWSAPFAFPLAVAL